MMSLALRLGICCLILCASNAWEFPTAFRQIASVDIPPCPASALATVKEKLRTHALNSENGVSFPAKYLFIAFHDCFTGACDASIVHETNRRENGNANLTLAFYEQARSGTCVSMADTIKLGLELAMELTGGPPVECPKGTHEDATEAGPDQKLPSPFDTFDVILGKFTSQDFTLRDALVGNFGGHSIGGFINDASSGLPRFKFTPETEQFARDFLEFVTTPGVKPAFSRSGLEEPGDFNCVPSDLTLALAEEASVILEWFKKSDFLFRWSFKKFLIKLCSK